MERKIVSGVMVTLLLTGMLTLAFKIQLVKAQGIIYIREDGSIDPPTAQIQRDESVYTFTGNIYDEIVVQKSNITIDGKGYTLQGDESGYGFYLSGVNNVTVKNTNIKDFERGVFLNSTSHNILLGNKIRMRAGGWQYGIYLSNSPDNKISVNEITGGDVRSSWDFCIQLSSSGNNTISGNKMTASFHGIMLAGHSDNNTVTGNEITTTQGTGVRLESSYENKISRNNITNHYNGILLRGYHNNNTILENNVKGNVNGVYLDSAWGNLLYHNNFVYNTVQVKGEDYVNYWDNGYPSGGNYWSDYNGTDQYSGPSQDQPGSDGIGDTPYIGNINNQDRYPLMSIWGVAAPPEIQVGVKAGDWIKCTYTVSGWPAGTPYSEWLKVEFLSVEGTTANIRVTMHMSDGTEPSQTITVDVAAGSGAFQGLSGFVIPANSTVGDSITMGGAGFTLNVTIDGETTRTYAGASRTVVYASFSQLGSQLTYYWDKQTGVMVEASTTSGSITATGKATETNMWEAVFSPFWAQWWFYAIVVVVILAMAGAVYFLKKRKPPTPTAPPLPTEGT